MDARRHRFSVKASRDQYFSLLILWAVFLTSLLAWPEHPSVFFLSFRIGVFALICGVFLYQFIVLKGWQWQFALDCSGRLEDELGSQSITRSWVTPFVCVMLIKAQDGGRRLGLVFADMLEEGDYRDLCRLLLSVRDSE